jgi:hypothetical protein
MKPRQRLEFDREIALGGELLARGDPEGAFRHLERAHVIGQNFVGAHAKAHWLMFKRLPIPPDLKEIIDGNAN